MVFIAWLLLVNGAALATAEDSCFCHPSPLVEREELGEDLPPIWDERPNFDCNDENIDAATTTKDKKTYFFKGDYYWRLIGRNVASGYPRIIAQDWDGLPGNLDAALTWKDGRTFFFKDKEYWSFHGRSMDSGYPRNISEGFGGIPNGIDGATLWGSNQLAYFFKGKQYWRFDGGETCTPVSPDYPRSMWEWKGMPTGIDDAVLWENGRTYFIKGGFYYRYDNNLNLNEAARPTELHRNWGLECKALRCRIQPRINETDSKTGESQLS